MDVQISEKMRVKDILVCIHVCTVRMSLGDFKCTYMCYICSAMKIFVFFPDFTQSGLAFIYFRAEMLI